MHERIRICLQQGYLDGEPNYSRFGSSISYIYEWHTLSYEKRVQELLVCLGYLLWVLIPNRLIGAPFMTQNSELHPTPGIRIT